MGDEVDNLDPLPPVLAAVGHRVDAESQKLLAIGRHCRATFHQNDDLTLTSLAALDQSLDAASYEPRLSTVAREYLVRGRGYATSLAREYYVTPRTVVSWVEKARTRGLLSSPPTRGAVGGHLVAKPARSESTKDAG